MENNYFKMIFEDLKNLWSKLDLPQKFGIVTLSAITLIAATYFLMKSMEPNWTVLYSGLSEQDSIAITESLKKSGYAYKLSSDKTSVLVPANKQEELRVFVAENDLIKNSEPGFELLDDMQLGSTEFKNKMTNEDFISIISLIFLANDLHLSFTTTPSTSLSVPYSKLY